VEDRELLAASSRLRGAAQQRRRKRKEHRQGKAHPHAGGNAQRRERETDEVEEWAEHVLFGDLLHRAPVGILAQQTL
jgi:hypothetical protein